MIFNVQEILKTDGARVQLAGELEPKAELEKDGMKFSGVSFSGVLENIGGVLELSVQVAGALTVPCARCLKETEQHFSASVQETLAKEDAEISDRDAVVLFTGTDIDLNEVIWPGVLLELDTKFLCRPDCRGLCIHCGADLNEGSCGCKNDEIDPRLAGLADLLQ